MSMVETDVLVLGAGVTGLAAAAALGDRAIVLERADRPGGLVRTDRIGDFWFDQVLHLLHVADPEVQALVTGLLGPDLAPCTPDAWVETIAGAARYPFQLHLATLPADVVERAVADLAAVQDRPLPPGANLEEFLLGTFGRTMCELFLLPHNRKLWKRPLAEIDPADVTWVIARPDLAAVLRGARDATAPSRPYNANGWYPRPPAGAAWRGMEVLSRALAARAADIRCGHDVVAIDLDARVVTARHHGGVARFRYHEACLSTLPLPAAVGLCACAPADLRRACAALPRNRVVTVMIGVRGPRPSGTGLWRYYADPSVPFGRLVFLHGFDPALAPDDGWGLLAEVTQRSEDPIDRDGTIRQVIAGIERVAALPAGSRIETIATRVIDPAYVVFSRGRAGVVDAAVRVLAAGGVSVAGRYGRWRYSSIAQDIADGRRWATQTIAGAAADTLEAAGGAR